MNNLICRTTLVLGKNKRPNYAPTIVVIDQTLFIKAM